MPTPSKNPNVYVKKDNYFEIHILHKNHKKTGIGFISEEDYSVAKSYNWSICTGGYMRNGDRRLHNLIMSKKDGLEIDHINHNKLDNRRSNLRHITSSLNGLNRKKQGGIYWCKQTKDWETKIVVGCKSYWLGRYKDYFLALIVRLKAEEILINWEVDIEAKA